MVADAERWLMSADLDEAAADATPHSTEPQMQHG